jgi:hypothetical protein
MLKSIQLKKNRVRAKRKKKELEEKYLEQLLDLEYLFLNQTDIYMLKQLMIQKGIL